MTQMFDRRSFLRGIGVSGLSLAVTGLAAPHIANAAATRLTIVSNPGLENATLNMLMEEQGFLQKFGADTTLVEAAGATGPFNAITSREADICMVSGYNMVLSRIEDGARVKIVGAGMRKPALTVFARPGIETLADLEGRTVAVGPDLGLLHALMLQLLRERKIDASAVNFTDRGSNDQAYQAVVSGEADACCSSISHLNDQDGLVVISEGNMWEALPNYVFQTAYAADDALQDKHENLVAVMAAYGSLYEYLMTPDARDAFLAARKRVQKNFDEASALAVWDFNQQHRPYSRDLSITDEEIGYLQDMFLGLGALKTRQPISAVADMTAAQAAAKRL